MDDEEYEQTLLIKKECFIYRIPPRPGAAGYKAQDWDPSTYIWSGRLVIIAKGDHCTIKFEDPTSGEIFAQCPVEPNSVEPVIDSSRYFVIKIKDQNRHAVVGMGFTDRSDAFDFNATLQDHQNYVRNKKQSEIAKQNYDNTPKQDYSLKSGQTIHIPFKSTSATTNLPKVTGSMQPTSGGGFLLSPPPPSNSRSVARPTGGAVPQQQQQHQQQFQFSFDGQEQQQQQQQPPQTSSNQPWGSSSFF
ncbi:hypothetical protein SAMD00019534_022580 [Acytostelium subglobosum LB1]|uniref:hypothetical protein n=1 Tax=Acytostelium subglobosum LB1 TaxID=1410327 RepID=UPI0006451F29|nr:hypothetical protein SAMD00019534_022580 [Acytostelium subglobosum LB1]GAM19083.1 hypothetical protein SAMD00019534_022580 [Acytostelium subglobosum LB1]|eukprot:XP_012757010.1 hypothetical protein SAMD00019534_022580 [Acytostelium subglobosum LB1]